MRIIILSLMALWLSACITTVPKMKKCEIPAGLEQVCGEPVKLPAQHKNSDERLARIENANRLTTCSLRHEQMLKMINTCNTEIDQHNQRIEQINKGQ